MPCFVIRTYCYSQGGPDRDTLLQSIGFPALPLSDDPKAYTGGSYHTSSETRRNSDESCGRDCFCSSPARITVRYKMQDNCKFADGSDKKKMKIAIDPDTCSEICMTSKH